ncbi:SHOCT domain-containing protein [Candidatus Pelagibacter sp.]|nr:SHOCT domain-containing protein [Candidatus Pelagibacter sp.]
MNKILLIIIVGIFFFSKANASNTKLIKGQPYETQIKWKHIKFNLPEGSWIYYDKSNWNFYHFHGSCANFISIQKKIIKGNYEICYVESGGKLRNQLGAFLQAEWKNNKYDNCLLRPEYFYAKFVFKGGSTNCFKTRHIETNKEIFFPDDPTYKSQARLKKYIKDNDLIIPITSIKSDSVYFSTRRDSAYSVSVVINPEFYGAPKSLYGLEDKSEYHRNNIDDHPIKKEFIMRWTKKMSIEHKYLEKQMDANPNFKLDFSDISLISSKKETTDLVEQIKKLYELLKSGAITKEEFEKAKKKLLN